MHTLDIIIIVSYLALCLIIGIMKATKIKNIREYTLGKGRFPISILIATTFATTIGVVETVGSVEKSYVLGAVFIITRLIAPFAWLILGRIFAYSIEEFQGCLTLSDIMEKMYGPLGRWTTNFCALAITTGVLAASTLAIGYVLEYFIGIPQGQGSLIGLAIIVIYSSFGGIQGVALTDVFQFIIFFIAFPVACAIGYHDIGGIGNIIEQLPESHLHISTDQIPLFASLMFYAFMPVTGIPFIQRALMAKNSKELTRIFDIVGLLSFPFVIVIALIGLITYIKDPNLNPNIALFYFISTYLPIGITGFMIASILAVIMSTVDSFLNTTSILCARDIIKQLKPDISDKQELFIARISTFVLAALSVSLAYNTPSIQDMLWLIDNFWDPVITVPLVLGMLKLRGGRKGYNYGVLLGVTGVLATRMVTGTFDTISLSVGCILSGITLIIFSKYYSLNKLNDIDVPQFIECKRK